MEEFGKRYGVSRQAVSLWESGESRPRPEVLKQMGVYYAVDVR
jgi:transcriptional regulator with XRE-family HTH domain